MKNAFGDPQTIVLLGGTSEIGVAIAGRLATASTRAIVLACRDTNRAAGAVAALEQPGRTIDVVEFDARDNAAHAPLIRSIVERHGDLDVVILAFGVLGTQEGFDRDPVAAAEAVQINYTGAVSVGLTVADQLRTQGHGSLVVLSSVAGERVRKANFVYGSSKAGLDGFAQGLGDSLVGSGASVLVVRPGFVHSKMTAGMKAAPLSTTPDKVAEAVASGLRRGSRTVWVPGLLRVMFSVLRHLPGPVWRRLPL
ncbi:MAG: decaprenylphospho-beta-D-erythro-pentofuranosid-2-ulose 2-reductase [Acidimicrobiia bacterium]